MFQDKRRLWEFVLRFAIGGAFALFLATYAAERLGAPAGLHGALLKIDVGAVLLVIVLALRDVHLRFHGILDTHPDLKRAHETAMRDFWLGLGLAAAGFSAIALGVRLARDMPLLGWLLILPGALAFCTGALLTMNLSMLQRTVWWRDFFERIGMDPAVAPLGIYFRFDVRAALFVAAAVVFGVPAVIGGAIVLMSFGPDVLLAGLLALVAAITLALMAHASWVERNRPPRDAFFRHKHPTPRMWLADGLITAALVWGVMGGLAIPVDHWTGQLVVFGGAALLLAVALVLLRRDRFDRHRPPDDR